MKVVIEIVRGARAGRRLELDDPVLVRFGRHPSCDVAFDPSADRDASARHAELRRVGDSWWVHDLGSINGTYVDGRAVERAEVPSGGEIEFGPGGPRVRVRYLASDVIGVQPRRVTNPVIGARTVAAMIDQALLRSRLGRTRERLVFAALLLPLLAVAGVLGWRWRTPRGQVAVAAAAGPDGAAIAHANRDAIFAVVLHEPSGAEHGFCTAFAVRSDRLITNAHCVVAAEDMRRRGGRILVVQNGHAVVRLPVTRMHRVAGFQPGAPTITPDVGWLAVADGLTTLVTLAPPREYRALQSGDAMYSYGFPGRLVDVRAPEATFVAGVIGRVTALDGRVADAAASRLIQHSAFTAGGTSGSPIFNGLGHVIAVNTGGYLDRESSDGRVVSQRLPGYNFGMRIDLAEELLSEAGE